MKGIYITGTDTGVGKSVVSGLLARYLCGKGYRVITQKWIQTASGGFPVDIAAHLKLMGKNRKDIKNYLRYICPYVFKFASSPHLAAALEKRKIRKNKIKNAYKFLSDRFDFVIVEGIGGALVPYDGKKLVLNIAKELRLPAIIVVGNRLGAINHTLLTIEALKKRDMDIIGLLFNNLEMAEAKILKDNIRAIKSLTGEEILGNLPRAYDRNRLYGSFKPIGKKILNKVKNG